MYITVCKIFSTIIFFDILRKPLLYEGPRPLNLPSFPKYNFRLYVKWPFISRVSDKQIKRILTSLCITMDQTLSVENIRLPFFNASGKRTVTMGRILFT